MADPDKIPETQSDTQATYDPTAENNAPQTRGIDNSLLSESQDFHLVDCDETPKETQDEAERTASEKSEECPKISVDSTKLSSSQGERKIEPAESTPEKNVEIAIIPESEDLEFETIEGEKDEPTDNERPKETENSKIEIEKEKELFEEEEEKKKKEETIDDDDDDDFVQSSQLETRSPLKKQISSIAIMGSQKRKAESNDETPAKFPRTCSQKDALSGVRKKLDDEIDEILTTPAGKDRTDDEIISSMIIQETQESPDIEKSTESLRQVEQELEEALSQHPFDEDDAKIRDNAEIVDATRLREIPKAKDNPENEESTEMKNLETASSEADELISKISEKLESSKSAIDSTTEKSSELEKTGEIMKISEKSTSTSDDTKEKSINEIVEAETTSRNDENDENSRKTNDACFVAPMSSARSRMSIEVVYDRSTAPPEKKLPRELVEIDEDGEKIVLDSSQESCDKSLDKSRESNKISIADTSYRTCASTDYKSIESSRDSNGKDGISSYSLTNGSGESRNDDTNDATTNERTDTSNDMKISAIATSPGKKKFRPLSGKILENPEILSISDSEESFVVEERAKLKERVSTSLNHDNSNLKTLPIERELNIMVKLKCLVYVDETTKEHVEKIITGVQCESASTDFSTSRHRNSDNSANLADISGNEKDTSPGSVTSIPHPYPLNQRLSLVSIASTSSSSSAGSLNAKIAAIKFQLPRGPAKQAKKITITDAPTTMEKIPENDSLLESINKEWKNIDTLTCTIMNCANQELIFMDQHNGSALRADNSIERIHSSTPEIETKDIKNVQSTTPKRPAKRSRTSAVANVAGKTTRAKNLRSSEINGATKDSPIVEIDKVTPSTSKKRKSSPVLTAVTPTRNSAIAKDETCNDDESDEKELLLGKQVFAKWSDNKYYPGIVIGKTKTKFRVNFYDGQSKLIIEDFIVPMPSTLNPGLSVYATSDNDDYGSCGIILEVKKNRDEVAYIVETDESEKIEVDIKNIFLTNDQVQVLKEESKVEMKSPPSTPKHLGKITLDNVIDGKRRSKRILTPVATTPKAKRGRPSLADKIIDMAKPSVSGTSLSVKFDDNHETTSDSNFSGNEDDGIGTQEEINGTPNEQDSKGQPGSVKGKGRGRKKSERPEIIANLGPVPGTNSELFKGMSFLLSCASPETIERYQTRESSKDTRDSNSDPGTENEEEWSKKPFVRERLMAQLSNGGGKIYDNFESIPSEDYNNTKHITNVPNTTRKSLLCLSVGIKSYNHQWVIRCCQENKIVNPSEEELPAGWSILKRSYIDMFQRRNEKPFQTLPVIVVMPVTPANKEFVSFWRQICENAGGAVLLVENPDDGFIEGTVVLTNRQCPTWVIEKASSWNIPLVSTAWIIECLIEGNICSDDSHQCFKYNYTKRSHISNLKRR